MTRLLLIALLAPALLRAEDGLAGRVWCGYQGWFRVPGDGSDNGWHHYAPGTNFAPGACHIDLWPDVRNLPPADRFPTAFRHADGAVAEVFSSTRPATIRIHFDWMREHGIDGAFVQRFATRTRDPRTRDPMDRIVAACRDAARDTGRRWALMYDLSGMTPGAAAAVIDDWTRLADTLRLTDTRTDPAYLRHRGKPLVALWGAGFNDRDPMLDDWRQLVAFFKTNAVPGGCSVLLGVPTYWRTLTRDAIPDPALHDLIRSADVVSPWTVGRYRTPDAAQHHASNIVTADLAWCRAAGLDYLPVAFPGFSWHNLMATRGKSSPVNEIPRLGGAFLWTQGRAFHAAGARSLYVAMFDELDEGTAIFKTRNDPPVGASPFVAEPGLPSDHYLWLTGQLGRLLRGEFEATDNALPPRASR